MAYTSIIPVSRLDNSITYIRNKDKTTKKGQSAGSLEEAIDYAMNRDKTERSVFEDAIGCVCATAFLISRVNGVHSSETSRECWSTF